MEGKRRGGWPARTPEPGERVPMSFRVTPERKANLDEGAKQSGRSLFAEIELMIELGAAAKDALDQAMRLTYGEDNAGLIHLFAEMLRVVAPHGGEWLDDETATAEVLRGFARLLKRLKTPDDGHVLTDGSPEARVDSWLYDLAYDDAGAYGISGARSPRARYMLSKRERFGPAIGDRLVEMRRAVREALEAMPPREWPPSDPDSPAAQSWARVTERLNEQPEAERVTRQVTALRRQITLFADAGGTPAQRKQLEVRITMLAADEVTKAELLAALAQAAPEGEKPDGTEE
jgi:hypothetical protein